MCLWVHLNVCMCINSKRLSLHNGSKSQSQNQGEGPGPRIPTSHIISSALLLRKNPHILHFFQLINKLVRKMCFFVDCTNLLVALRKWIYNQALFAGPFLKWRCRHEIKKHTALPLCEASKEVPPWKERNGHSCPAWLNCSQYSVLTALSRG